MSKTKLILALALVALAAAAPAAQAYTPSKRDRLDAKRFARDYWAGRGEVIPCYGVRLAFVPRWAVGRYFGHGTLAAVYDDSCTIYYNQAAGWSWGKLCSVTVHEYGHIIGIGHSRNPYSIMNPSYQ